MGVMLPHTVARTAEQLVPREGLTARLCIFFGPDMSRPPENFYPRIKIFSDYVKNFCPTLKIFVRPARPCLKVFSSAFSVLRAAYKRFPCLYYLG